MNPTILHFSRGGAFIQLAFMAGMGALALWLLFEMGASAQPQPFPAQGTEFRLGQAAPIDPDAVIIAPAPNGNRSGNGIQAMILIACLPLALWEISIKLWRLLTPKPALALIGRQLVLHPSFMKEPSSIPTKAIREVIVDRADRVPFDGFVAAMLASSWSHRLGLKVGARFRHTMLIKYVTENGKLESVRIGDANISGGTEQLRQFAAYLEQSRMAGVR